MSRPKITLQEWLNKDQALKIKFLRKESEPTNFYGLLNWQKSLDETILITERMETKDYILYAKMDNTSISISIICFSKLRDKFRIFKNQLKNSKLIKKQYNFSNETVNNIKKIKTDLNFLREEQVIEHLIINHINNKTMHQTKIKLKTKEIKLDILNLEINNNNQKIYDLTYENNFLKNKIKNMSHFLAESHLNIEHFKDILLEHNLPTELPIHSEDKIQIKIIELNEK